MKNRGLSEIACHFLADMLVMALALLIILKEFKSLYVP